MRPVLSPRDQMCLDRVLVNVLPELQVLLHTPDPPVMETGLPDLPIHSQLSACPKRKAAFDQLHGSFQSNLTRSDQEMNVVWHDHELMEQVFLLGSVVIEDVD